MTLQISSLAERPDLASGLFELVAQWPAFMADETASPPYFSAIETAFADSAFVAYDSDDSDRVLARALSVPVHWDGDPATSLPAAGWDAILSAATADYFTGATPNLVSALDITVCSSARGRGLSSAMLDTLRQYTQRRGLKNLVAPVRPSTKHLKPQEPIAAALATRDDGLPMDPWLRVHVRAGGRIVGIAPTSMTFSGTLEQWRAWTGLPFDAEGPVVVPGALVPVHCDLTHGVASYVEPNIWVQHCL